MELGAGRAIPTIRSLSVRNSKGVGIALAALDALAQLDTLGLTAENGTLHPVCRE